MIIDEMVLAIDPALHKVEEILLWQNKFKTGAVFTFFHFLFWLFQNFNIRTYCTISCVLLVLHLLDAYRTKKRREILRLQQSSKSKNVSSIGRYIIFVYTKLMSLWNELIKLKRKNRLQYFLLVIVLWSMGGVIGYKIKGFYLSYALFWIVFFVPAIIHYDLMRKLIRKAMPLLEQLDHSMKYERRSVLDKSQLLVDVKLPESDEADEQEDEYLRSFKLDDLDKMKLKQRKVFENLQDDEDDDEEGEELDMEEMDSLNDADGSGNKTPIEYEEYEESYVSNQSEAISLNKVYLNVNNERPTYTTTTNDNSNKRVLNENAREEYNNKDYDDINSFLPNESMPAFNDELESSSNSYLFNASIDSGDKVVKQKKTKNRPSLLDYYGDNSAAAGTTSSIRPRHQHNEQDIDETFDFLDEELNKYSSKK